MTSNRWIGIAFAALVLFSVICAIYVYRQQQELANAAASSALYLEEKARLLSQLEHDKGFAERLVDESLQHRKKVDDLERKLLVNERALKSARAVKEDTEHTDPLNEDPELPILRERVSILENQKQEQQKENDLLKLAVDKSQRAVVGAETLEKITYKELEKTQKQLRQEKRRKIGWSIAAGVIGGAIGYGLGSI